MFAEMDLLNFNLMHTKDDFIRNGLYIYSKKNIHNNICNLKLLNLKSLTHF